jgi:hypothetical protein
MILWFSTRPKYSASDTNKDLRVIGEDVTVILPVYGQIHVVRYLFDQLEIEQKSFPFKLQVVDDAYDEHSTKWLKNRLSDWDQTMLIVNPFK